MINRQIKLNTQYVIRMSPESIEEYQKLLEQRKKDLPKIAQRIVERVAEVGLEDNYESTEKIPVENNGGIISSGIKTTDKADTYKEYGTGIVGSEHPHPDILSGWIYDVNEHGEKGWIYPKGDGSYGWTKGIAAQGKFYRAMNRMETALPFIAQEEFNK